MARKKKLSESVIETMREAGKTNFPVADACRLAGITLEEFAESEDLQAIYRMAQLETQLAIRKAILADALGGNSVSVKIYLDKFDAPVLPDLADMPDDEDE